MSKTTDTKEGAAQAARAGIIHREFQKTAQWGADIVYWIESAKTWRSSGDRLRMRRAALSYVVRLAWLKDDLSIAGEFQSRRDAVEAAIAKTEGR